MNISTPGLGSVSKRVPKLTYRNCRSCGRPSTEVGDLSHQRLCFECGQLRKEANALGIALKTGDAWLRWRRSMAASVGGVLLDESRERP